MVDPKDAEGITVPVCMLASKDEDPEAVNGFEKNLKVASHVETFGDQVHVCQANSVPCYCEIWLANKPAIGLDGCSVPHTYTCPL